MGSCARHSYLTPFGRDGVPRSAALPLLRSFVRFFWCSCTPLYRTGEELFAEEWRQAFGVAASRVREGEGLARGGGF